MCVCVCVCVCINTQNSFHLFDETMPFLRDMEKKYKFKAEIFQVCS